MALNIEIDSADDILQFVKVLFVSAELIQNQVKEANQEKNKDFVAEIVSLTLRALDRERTIIEQEKQKQAAKKLVVKKPIAKKVSIKPI